MKSYISQSALVATASLILAISAVTHAILVQPYNYMLDDSSMVNQHDSGSLSPFYNDQSGANEHSADKDIVSIIGDSLARLRFGRMLDHNNNQQVEVGADNQGHFSQQMAELIQNEQANGKQDGSSNEQQTFSSSVANMLLNVAQAAAQVSTSANDENQREQEQGGSGQNGDASMSSRGSIMELDTSQTSSNGAGSMPSKADLKVGPSQWFNPKETIPVLKISSMATPSKYKKVYFRSEKKLVDGAFHSPSNEQDEKKSLVKPFSSGVQRRSSRGTSSSAPPSILQDGVIDFLKKFRDVYIQTRPIGAGSSSSASNLASSVVSAAASSPFASVLSPSSGSRPNLASALSAASSMVNSAAMLSQASPSSVQSSPGSASSATGAAGAATTSPNKSPLTPQSYVSFWSKTFPTWVRKMLKQMRRRSLYNSKRNQQHAAAAAIGQKIASGAVSSVVESSSNSASGSSGSSSSSQSQSSSSSSSR